MTFAGTCWSVPSGTDLHPFENLRREGVNERGRWRMSRARFTACHLPWTADSGCACLSPGERTQKGEKTRQGMSRNPPQRRSAASETALRLTARRHFAGVQKAQATARQGRRDRNGRSKPAVDVATEGWKPAAPEGPGRDSAAGSVRSMTAPVPAREVARCMSFGNTRPAQLQHSISHKPDRKSTVADDRHQTYIHECITG